MTPYIRANNNNEEQDNGFVQ